MFVNFLRLLWTVLLTKYVIYREFLLFPKASTSIQAGGTAPDNTRVGVGRQVADTILENKFPVLSDKAIGNA